MLKKRSEKLRNLGIVCEVVLFGVKRKVDYFVQFGRMQYVGRLASELIFQRGEQVVIRTIRGLELARVLCLASERYAKNLHDVNQTVECIRKANESDLTKYHSACELAQQILLTSEKNNQKPVVWADCEAMLDGQFFLLHVIPLEPCDLSDELNGLRQKYQAQFSLVDLSHSQKLPDAPNAQDGCGKPNCGQESNDGKSGCSGCSTGGCSRGAVKSAGELTEYFQNLRQQMEQTARVALN
jgi:hypothetical protein